MSSKFAIRALIGASRYAKRPVCVARQSYVPQIYQWNVIIPKSFSTQIALHVKKYSEDHEWIEIDTDGKTGTIGITDYAANALGDVVYVELPEVGLEVNKGDAFGAVESVKSASDILSPVSGTITENNPSLEEKPGNINKSPEGDAWIAKIELSDSSELESLMSKEEYTKFSQESE